MIMKRPGEYMMIAFFQTMFMFGHRPWKVADPSTDDHMGVGAVMEGYKFGRSESSGGAAIQE